MSALRDALRDLPEPVFADLLESENTYLIVVDLPGATSETTDVVVESGRITIETRREKATPEGYRYVREDRPLFLDIDLPLPPDADGSSASAEMDRGILELTVPKRDSGEGQPIEVGDG
ncbi:Hsp20/alpha crystallin family protein [Halopenitus sp. H-Gu1]|uniref:Hsp20/alpha crystallin family protein n=1 Tax=Halopenitus sp. H-Gu1 TaxID=3242697 RepID=UPI00359D267A